MTWNLKDLINHCNTNQTLINNKWIPVRPLNYKYRKLKQKVIESYKVFKGEIETFRWPENQ